MADAEEFRRCRHIHICPGIALQWHVDVRSDWGRRPLQNTCSIPIENQPAAGQLGPQNLNEGDKGQPVIIAGRDPHRVPHARWHTSLPKRTVAPGDNAAAGTQRKGMKIPGNHGHNVGKTCWHICLAESVVAPGQHCSIGAQGYTMPISGSNGHNVGQTRWGCGLVVSIVPPAKHSPIIH